MDTVHQLKNYFIRDGRVEWIGVRQQKDLPIKDLKKVEAIAGHGLSGDKAGRRAGGKRQVTLIQAEYLSMIQGFLSNTRIALPDFRRNIAVSGINLHALKDRIIQVGTATMEVTGYCHPCRKLEEQLGHGVFNALRGHGGLTAKVIQSGIICIGDAVRVTDL